MGVRGPRDPDRRDLEARAGLQAPPELRSPRGDGKPPLAARALGSVGPFLARRLLQLGPVLLGVSVIVFLVLHLAPGDPAEVMLGANANKEDLDRLRVQLGLDQPLHVQYVTWISHVARGDLGRSLWMKRPVLGEVLERFKATLLLTGQRAPPLHASAASPSASSRPRAPTRSSTASPRMASLVRREHAGVLARHRADGDLLALAGLAARLGHVRALRRRGPARPPRPSRAARGDAGGGVGHHHRPPHPRHDAGDARPGLCPHRARQGPGRAHGGLASRAQERAHSRS